jgi:hypothetical protein
MLFGYSLSSAQFVLCLLCIYLFIYLFMFCRCDVSENISLNNRTGEEIGYGLFQVESGTCLEGLWKIAINICRTNRCNGWDSNGCLCNLSYKEMFVMQFKILIHNFFLNDWMKLQNLKGYSNFSLTSFQYEEIVVHLVLELNWYFCTVHSSE